MNSIVATHPSYSNILGCWGNSSFFFIFLFTLHLYHCPLPSLPSYSPSPIPTSPSPLRGWSSSKYPPTLSHQASAELGPSSPTEARQGSHEDWAICLLHMCLGASFNTIYILWLVAQILKAAGVQICWFCWFSCRVPIYFWAFVPSPNSSVGVPDHLLLSNVSLWISVSVSFLCWV